MLSVAFVCCSALINSFFCLLCGGQHDDYLTGKELIVLMTCYEIMILFYMYMYVCVGMFTLSYISRPIDFVSLKSKFGFLCIGDSRECETLHSNCH